jgi:hypothetical protein
MTSTIEYSNIDKNAISELGSVTLRQGIKFKKYQSKIKKNVEKKNLLFEGFQGLQGNLSMNDSDLTTSQTLQNTQNLINQTDANVTSQIKELQELQNKYKMLLEQFNGANGSLNVAIKDYVKEIVGKDSKNTNVYVNSVANNVNDNYLGCYADTGNRSMTGTSSLSGQYVSYDQCKQSAVDSAFKYFGLQDFRSENQTGWCGVSNDLNATKQYGEAFNDNAVALWASNTSGQGNIVAVNPDGRLLVKDAIGEVLWQSLNAPAECSWGGGINSVNATYGANCNGSNNWSVQNGNATNSVLTSTNPEGLMSTNYVVGAGMPDVAYGCPKAFDISYKCGNVDKNGHIDGEAGGRNFLIDCTNEYDQCKFSLILQDDGNMCLYKNGSANSVWCTMTNGKQQSQNPNWAASKGKYGANILTTNQALAAGEFMGSTDGSLKLIMQTDGNLVLYTSNPQLNCTKGSNGNMYGGGWANAVYELDKVGILGDLGKVGYVDDDSKLSEYPASMFAMDKTTNMPMINNNKSCTKNIDTIDTINWDAYAKTGVPMSQNTVCGLEKATQNENIYRDAIKMQLAAIADEIVNKITYLISLNTSMNNQMGIDKTVLQENLKKYQEISKQYNQYNSVDSTNINGILSDSDIVVLQENYSYLFWSILAIAIVVVTIHAIKK